MTGTWRYQWWTHVLLDEFSVRLEQLHHNNMLETCLLQNGSTCMKFIEILVVSCSTTVCYHCARLWVRPSVSSAALTQQPDVSASPVTIRWAQDFAELQVTASSNSILKCEATLLLRELLALEPVMHSTCSPSTCLEKRVSLLVYQRISMIFAAGLKTCTVHIHITYVYTINMYIIYNIYYVNIYTCWTYYVYNPPTPRLFRGGGEKSGVDDV